nr:WHG domain-containing protein [Chitinophaga nivalis]
MRRRIVDAAITMFVKEGFEKMSIRNIADMIEYSPATIYLYYKDKDELLYDVQAEAFETLAREFESKITEADPLKRLAQLSWAYVEFARNHPELYDLMFIIKEPMNSVNKDENWKNGDRAYDALQDLVTECIEKKLIRYTDPMVATLSFWGFAHGLVSLNLRCRLKVAQIEEAEIKDKIDACIKAYLEIIVA